MATGVLRAVAVLAAAALPALAGCGTTTADHSPLPTGALSAPVGATPTSRPTPGPALSFPPDVHLVFDYAAATGGSTPDAVLRDWEIAQRVFAAAETVPDPRFRYLPQYVGDKALAASVGALQAKVQRQQTIIGTKRFYNIRFAGQAGSQAQVLWCEDDSQFFARDKKTGKAVVHHGPGDHVRTKATLKLDTTRDIWVQVDTASEVGVRC